MDAANLVRRVGTCIGVATDIKRLCKKYMKEILHAPAEIEKFRNTVKEYIQLLGNIETLAGMDNPPKLKALNSFWEGSENYIIIRLEEIKQILQTDMDKVEEARTHRGCCGFLPSKVALKWPFTKPEIEEFMKELQDYLGKVDRVLRMDQASLNQIMTGVTVEEKYKRLLSEIPVAHEAAYDSRQLEHEGFCLEGTREAIRQKLREWSVRDNGPSLFWLRGMTGLGKTTIARSFAKDLKAGEEKRLAGSFLFRKGATTSEGADKLIATLAGQLAETSDRLKETICKAIANNPGIGKKNIEDQFRILILEPMTLLRDAPGPKNLVFVVDGLDECENAADARRIMEIFTKASLSEAKLRIFVTSRPEPHILLAFPGDNESCQSYDLWDVADADAHRDMCIFVREQLSSIRKARHLDETWPSNDLVEKFVAAADKLFVFAKTACLYISYHEDPEEALEEVLRIGIPADRLAMAHSMYATVLNNYLGGREAFENRVGTILVLKSQLSPCALAALLHVEEKDIRRTLCNLQSVLYYPDASNKPIDILHGSFRDFILDGKQCSLPKFHVEKTSAHEYVAMKCMSLMQGSLIANKCNLSEPGALLEELRDGEGRRNIPHEVRYACEHWASHASESGNLSGLSTMILEFLENYFLKWVEFLALLQKLPCAISALKRLGASDDPALKVVLQESENFLVSNAQIISESPLQVYHGALVFAPTTMKLWGDYRKSVKSCISDISGTGKDWNPCIESWDCQSASFLPHVGIMISTSRENRTEIRDIVQGTLVDLPEFPLDLSEAGLHLGRSLFALTIRSVLSIWDLHQSKRIYSKSFESPLSKMVFPESGDRFFALLFRKGTHHNISVYDVRTEGSLVHTKDVEDFMHNLTISPNGMFVAYETRESGVRVLNFEKEDDTKSYLIPDLEGRICGFIGKYLLLRSLKRYGRQGEISVYHAPDGNFLHLFPTHYLMEKWCTTLHAPKCRTAEVIVTCDRGFGISLIQLQSGRTLATLRGHTAVINAVDISDDNTTLVSASWDNTIRLWDIKSETCVRIARRKNYSLLGIWFAGKSNERLILHENGKVQLWNVAKVPGSEEKGFSDSIISTVTFSSDCRMALWSSSMSNSARLYSFGDARTFTLQDFNHNRSTQFSPNNKLVASSLSSRLLILCHLTPNPTTYTLATDDHVLVWVFSPDSNFLAHCEIGKICLWTCSNGRRIEEKYIPSECNYTDFSMAFSPDGCFIAIMTQNGTVYLWSIGQNVCTAKECMNSLSAMLPYSDSQPLTVIFDGTIRIWDLTAKKECCVFTTQDDKVVHAKQSPNRQLTVTLTNDGDLHISDSETRQRILTVPGLHGYMAIEAVTEGANSIALSSDVTSILLNDPTTGEPASKSIDYTGPLSTFVLSSDLSLMALARGNIIELRKTSSTDVGPTLHGHKHLIKWLSFSPNDELIASSSVDHHLIIWNTSSGRCLDDCSGSLEPCSGSPFSSDSNWLAYWDPMQPHDVHIKNSQDWASPVTLTGHNDKITSIAWAPDSTQLASASKDSIVIIWDAAEHVLIHRIKIPREFNVFFKFSPDGSKLAIAWSFEAIIELSIATGEICNIPHPRWYFVFAWGYCTDGRLLACVKPCKTRGVQIYDISTNEPASFCSIHPRHAGLSDTMLSFCIFGAPYAGVLWDEAEQKFLPIQLPTARNSVFFTGNRRDRKFIQETQQSALTIIDGSSGERIARFLDKGIQCLPPSPDGTLLPTENAGTCGERCFSIVNTTKGTKQNVSFTDYVESGFQEPTPVEEKGVVLRAFTKSSGEDDPLSLEKVSPFIQRTYRGSVWLSTISAKALFFAHRSKTGKVAVFNADSRTCVLTIDTNPSWTRPTCFSDDENLFAVITDKNIVVVWSLEHILLKATIVFESPIHNIRLSRSESQGDVLEVTHQAGTKTFELQHCEVPHPIYAYWVTLDRKWLMWNEYRILWIPDSYRAHTPQLRESKLILISETDFLTLSLDPDMDPTQWTVGVNPFCKLGDDS